MSLMKWLSAGKSWFSWEKSEPRYRVVDDSFLPKFGGSSGIVGGAPVGSVAAEKTGGAEAVATGSRNRGLAGGRPVILKDAPPEPAPASKVTRLEAPAEEKKRPESIRPGAKPYHRLVQSELSLDAVKVVRNDLSDADLEIVRVKQPAKAAPSAPAGPASLDGLFGGGRPKDEAPAVGASVEGREPGMRRWISGWFGMGGAVAEQA